MSARFRAPLGSDDGSLDDLGEVIGRLEGAAGGPPVVPSAGFADRVMRAVAKESPPGRTAFLGPLHARGPVAGFAESVRLAWASAFGGGGGGRALGARGLALAYVLVVALAATSISGVAAFGAAGAFGLLGPNATETPDPTVVPTRPDSTVAPQVTPQPTPVPLASPEPSEEPSETPDESDDAGASDEPEWSDDHAGEIPGPSATDDDESSPDASRTPRPSSTPENGAGE